MKLTTEATLSKDKATNTLLFNWLTKRNIENSTNFKVSLDYYNEMSRKAREVIR